MLHPLGGGKSLGVSNEVIQGAKRCHALLNFRSQQVALQCGFGQPNIFIQVIEQVTDCFALGGVEGTLLTALVDNPLGRPPGHQYEGHKKAGHQQVAASNAVESEVVLQPGAWS